MARATDNYKQAKLSIATVLSLKGMTVNVAEPLSALTDTILVKDFAPISGGTSGIIPFNQNAKLSFNFPAQNSSISVSNTVSSYNAKTSIPDNLIFNFTGISSSNWIGQTATFIIYQSIFEKSGSLRLQGQVCEPFDILISDPFVINKTINNLARSNLLETDSNTYYYDLRQKINNTYIPLNISREITLVDDRVVTPPPVPPTGTDEPAPVPPTGTN